MRQTVYQTTNDDRAQMLLATGVVLLLSLLSMAVFSVKVAGLTSAHEANSDSVIETTKEVMLELPSLAENRTELWINGGLERIEAADIAMESIHDDLLHHGEIRGVEVKMLNITIVVVDSSLPNPESICSSVLWIDHHIQALRWRWRHDNPCNEPMSSSNATPVQDL